MHQRDPAQLRSLNPSPPERRHSPAATDNPLPETRTKSLLGTHLSMTMSHLLAGWRSCKQAPQPGRREHESLWCALQRCDQ